MARPSKTALSAIDQLRARVEQAQVAALADPLRSTALDELRTRAEAHKLGTVASGWVNPYPKTDPRALLLQYQFANFHDRARFKASLQARQTGKDFTSEGEIVEDCYQRTTDWMVAAPSERQSLDSLDQAKLWGEAFDLVVADYKEEREGSTSQTLLKSAEITFSNKSRIRAVPGKPDTVRGRSSNVLITEFDFLEQPQATLRALLPSITNPLRGGLKRLRVVSTPNGKGSAMHKIWTKADTAVMQWSRHLVTIYHAVLMGLPVDIAQIREALDDAEGWAQEYECEFLDGSNVLLPYEIIALAESLEATEYCPPEFWTSSGNPVVLGIDFGRTNDPTICWATEQVGDVDWTREVLALRDMATPEQEAALDVRIRRATRVCFDYTGPGIGLGDYLVAKHGEWAPEKHKFGKIELCTFTAGFKREIFPKMRRAFEAPTKLRIPVSTTVREDLHAMRQIIRNGEYTYSAPRTAEGHSDRCTALALNRRARGSATTSSFFIPVPFSRQTSRAAARSERTCSV